MNRSRKTSILPLIMMAFTFSCLLCDITFAKPVVPSTFQEGMTETRTWSNNSGKFQVDAILMEVKDDAAVLKKTNGRTISVPLKKLSTIDQAFIADLLNPPAKVETTDDPLPGVNPPGESGLPGVGTPNPKTKSDPNDPNSANATTTFDPLLGPNGMGEEPKEEVAPIPKVEMVNVGVGDVAKLPDNYQEVGKILLSSKDSFEIRQSLKKLQGQWPAKREQTLIDLVANKTLSDDKFTRELALALLIQRDAEKSFPYIIQRIDDPSISVRDIAFNGIKQLKDPSAIEPVAQRLATQDGIQVSTVLMAFGSRAEKSVHSFLTHENSDARLRACSLLNKIGTKDSLDVLSEMHKNDENLIVRLQAKSAMQNIRKRGMNSKNGPLGPGASNSPKGNR